MNLRLILIFLVLFPLLSIAQATNNKLTLVDDFEWSEGKIMLSSGEELIGLVKFNDRNGVLAYHDGDNSRPFGPRSVLGFDFFDERVQQQRIFYSLEDEDPQTNVMRPLFFELLRDYKTFAIMLRTDRTEVKEKMATSPGGYNNGVYYNPSINNSSLELSQTQTVCILDDNGKVFPYFKCTKKEDGRKSWFSNDDVRTKNKMINDDLIREYISQTDYSKIVQYADENKLDFKKLDDFLKILKYYDSLIAD
ncbi:MAG TPA: hypothetical protein PLJ60_09160 [Chryseolinea sp.]|nr:hypothetical protein [Chryseolinea sp.]